MSSERNSSPDSRNEARQEACCRIQASLALLALRRQKKENDELKCNVRTLSEKTNILQLQRYALRQLLDAEKIRLAIINIDMHKLLCSLEEYKQEKGILLKEKEQLQDRIKALEEKFHGMENEYRNQKNELLTAKLEAKSWEDQLEKERGKLLKIRSEKRQSIEDVEQSSEQPKDTAGGSNRKLAREAKIKTTACRNAKKAPPRGKDSGKSVATMCFKS